MNKNFSVMQIIDCNALKFISNIFVFFATANWNVCRPATGCLLHWQWPSRSASSYSCWFQPLYLYSAMLTKVDQVSYGGLYNFSDCFTEQVFFLNKNVAFLGRSLAGLKGDKWCINVEYFIPPGSSITYFTLKLIPASMSFCLKHKMDCIIFHFNKHVL